MSKNRYGAIDGLRMIAAFGIVMMHMQANNDYEISGFLYETVIPSFTNFVFLFMTVSAFGMCCGYYKKILNREISVSDFYGKRFKKIFPFFAALVLLDIIISPSVDSLYEGFADLTLLFGLLPHCGGISVIGVGWFLGLIFVFYLCFPFFCCLIENKKRAWAAFGISLVYNIVCTMYFDVGRNNILYSGCFFLAGGLIYLYRDKIAELSGRCISDNERTDAKKAGISPIIARCLCLGAVSFSVIIYYIIGGNTFTYLLVSVVLLIYAISVAGGVLENKITKFFSSISMEIYLSHMVIFRILEKLHLNTVLGNGWLQYITTVILAIAGATVFAVVMKKVMEMLDEKVKSINGMMK